MSTKFKTKHFVVILHMFRVDQYCIMVFNSKTGKLFKSKISKGDLHLNLRLVCITKNLQLFLVYHHFAMHFQLTTNYVV